ncbi:alpha/beta hydrolase fold protein [Aspergillus heteromorphus CBS 117.55]|uniref:Alpha/beta hydrolase fold protein n=1 Tax=Aspergillus heteromorphus CBS 117.55 TaxID=1448321 RepID=A0A317VT67_9EURO|nr:alpha/beta hydrolase fold protein [Aspergillus heteromorphus CBS 117.55]PWY77516.1 alpha/beta hydrolase fold protein [Aspergillus heteromorphus CBS 117.55]
MSSWDQPLSLWEKMREALNRLAVLATVLRTAVTGIFRGQSGAKQYSVHVACAAVRRTCVTYTPRQLQTKDLPTDEAYRQFMAAQGLPPDTVPLKHGAQGHWIGDKNAKTVVVYYHGGGFFLNAYPEHFRFVRHVVKRLDNNIAFFFLSYTLTPHAAYPVQLRQSVEALRYILTETDRSPANVVLGGDSAGANLALAVLLHLSHPHPDIEPLQLSQPLAGVFGHAPWLSYRTDGPSMHENTYKDMICVEALDKWSTYYLGNKGGDAWSEPATAPAEWWGDAKTEQVLIVAGGNEVLLSTIGEFVEKNKNVLPNLVYVVGAGETHASAIYAADLVGHDTQQGEAIVNWLGAKL